jgi:UDP-N-acetylmuramoyl-L-alanyl-D-glutamate--2,6-diaminopimelate ligase
MEVSSHALVQQRVSPALFDIAVFTNLSRDHLDYHQTMAAYAAAKKQLFLDNENQIAIMNADDATTQEWLTQWQHHENLWLYSIEQPVTQTSHYLRATNIAHHQQGIRFTLVTPNGDYEIASPLMGRFNIENLLAAISVLAAQQVAIADIVPHIPAIKTVMGRMETFSQRDKATTVVDYAHTPDGLKQALIACRQHCTGDIWLIFGCGGDRDKGKRAEMGEIAEQLADHVVITNDNPRTEAPEFIAQDILSGCKRPERVTIMLDRLQAIKTTIAKAKANDIVLLAGKGHEDYIEINHERIPYNERAFVASLYQQGENL